jgi:hypothetical protein
MFYYTDQNEFCVSSDIDQMGRLVEKISDFEIKGNRLEQAVDSFTLVQQSLQVNCDLIDGHPGLNHEFETFKKRVTDFFVKYGARDDTTLNTKQR